MITAKAVQDRIAEICSAVTWVYNNKPCGVDPYGSYKFVMWYGDVVEEFTTVEDVMNEPFFDGKTIEEIIPDMVDYDEG